MREEREGEREGKRGKKGREREKGGEYHQKRKEKIIALKQQRKK